jgi:hypothetical protein
MKRWHKICFGENEVIFSLSSERRRKQEKAQYPESSETKLFP